MITKLLWPTPHPATLSTIAGPVNVTYASYTPDGFNVYLAPNLGREVDEEQFPLGALVRGYRKWGAVLSPYPFLGHLGPAREFCDMCRVWDVLYDGKPESRERYSVDPKGRPDPVVEAATIEAATTAMIDYLYEMRAPALGWPAHEMVGHCGSCWVSFGIPRGV